MTRSTPAAQRAPRRAGGGQGIVYCVWYGRYDASLQKVFASRESAERWIDGLSLDVVPCDPNDPSYLCMALRDSSGEVVDWIGGGQDMAELRQRMSGYIAESFEIEEVTVNP